MTPFRDNGHFDEVQKKYNKSQASTRVEVERAIGLLKCKFRRFKYLDMGLETEISNVIAACCVLHNFIIDCEGEDVDVDYNDVEESRDSHTVDSVQSGGTGTDRRLGEEKRLEIALSL